MSRRLAMFAVLVALLAMCASCALAKTVVVEKPQISFRGPVRDAVLKTAATDVLAGFVARGDNVTMLDRIADEDAAKAAGNVGADEVWFNSKLEVESIDHVSGFPGLTMKRYNKGKTWLSYDVLNVQTGEVSHVVTPESEPWAVQPGDKVSPWILVGAGLLADAAATNHAFKYAGDWARPSGYVVGTAVYLVGSQANWTESLAVVAGETLIGKDWLPYIGDYRWLGLAGIVAPFYTARGDPNQLAVMSVRKAIENTIK